MTTKAATKKKAAPKKKTTNTTKKAKVDEPALQLIQTSKCPNLSNKGNITYKISTDDKNNIFIQIVSNSGGGFFSNEHIKLDSITALLSNIPADRPITSLYLSPLFTGKSVNSPGYLLAVLLNEGLLTPFEGKKRKYAYTSVKALSTKATQRKKAK